MLFAKDFALIIEKVTVELFMYKDYITLSLS